MKAKAKKFFDINDFIEVKTLLDVTPYSCVLVNNNFDFLYCNNETKRLFKKFDDKNLNKNLFDLYPQLDHIKDILHEIQDPQTEIPYEFEFYNNETFHWIKIKIVPYDKYFFLYFRDVTRRKEEQMELVVIRDNFSEALQDSRITISRQDRDLKFTWFFSSNANYNRLIGKTDFDYDKSEATVSFVNAKKRVLQTGVTEKMESKSTVSGKIYEVKISPIYDVDKEIIGITTTAIDITSMRNAESKLKEAYKLLQDIIDSVSDPIYIKDTDCRYLFANKAAFALLGNMSDVIGKTDNELNLYERAQKFMETDLRIINGGDPEVVEEEIVKDGERIVFLSTKAPFIDPDGRLIGLLGISKDITVIKQDAERKDEFISLASHELKTPLTSLKAYLQIAIRECSQSGQPTDYLQKMDEQVIRLTKITNQLLDITKIQSGQYAIDKKSFDINILIKKIIEESLLQRKNRKINIHGNITRKIYGDEDKIGQVLINLLSNAFKYSDDSKDIEIGLEENREEAIIFIRDYGIGIKEENLNKIFDMYFRTPEKKVRAYAGLGLGLYISSKIIAGHGGRIWAKSKVGDGTTFYFSIPFSR